MTTSSEEARYDRVSELLPTLDRQKTKRNISGQFPADRRQTLKAGGKTESLFPALSSGPHIHLATDFNTKKCASVSWSRREYDHLLASVSQNMFSRIALV